MASGLRACSTFVQHACSGPHRWDRSPQPSSDGKSCGRRLFWELTRGAGAAVIFARRRAGGAVRRRGSPGSAVHATRTSPGSVMIASSSWAGVSSGGEELPRFPARVMGVVDDIERGSGCPCDTGAKGALSVHPTTGTPTAVARRFHWRTWRCWPPSRAAGPRRCRRGTTGPRWRSGSAPGRGTAAGMWRRR